MATMHNRMTWEPTGLLGSMKHRDRARLRIAFVIFATAFLLVVYLGKPCMFQLEATYSK
jgi:hypothetical protein